jgi:hypothetical protein
VTLLPTELVSASVVRPFSFILEPEEFCMPQQATNVNDNCTVTQLLFLELSIVLLLFKTYVLETGLSPYSLRPNKSEDRGYHLHKHNNCMGI